MRISSLFPASLPPKEPQPPLRCTLFSSVCPTLYENPVLDSGAEIADPEKAYPRPSLSFRVCWGLGSWVFGIIWPELESLPSPWGMKSLTQALNQSLKYAVPSRGPRVGGACPLPIWGWLTTPDLLCSLKSNTSVTRPRILSFPARLKSHPP